MAQIVTEKCDPSRPMPENLTGTTKQLKSAEIVSTFFTFRLWSLEEVNTHDLKGGKFQARRFHLDGRAFPSKIRKEPTRIRLRWFGDGSVICDRYILTGTNSD